MRVYLSGAENTTHRALLNSEAVAQCFEYWPIRTRHNNVMEITHPTILEFGGKRGEVSDDVLDRLVQDYYDLVVYNLDDLDFFVECDLFKNYDRQRYWRNLFEKLLPPGRFVPMIRPGADEGEVIRLAQEYGRVGMTAAVAQDDRVRRALRGFPGLPVHVAGSLDQEVLEGVRADSCSTAAWLAPVLYGETVLWDRNRLRRVSKKYQAPTRRRGRARIEDLGVDAQAVIDNDNDAVTLLAIRSIKRHAEILGTDIPSSVQQHQTELDIAPDRTLKLAEPRESRSLLPILDVRTAREVVGRRADGTPIEDEVEHIGISSRNLLQCNTCALRTRCPMMRPDAECAYEIPIILENEKDLNRLQTALLEMQAQRIMMGRFAESLDGGTIDETLSAEMERFFKMVKIAKENQDSRDYLKIEARGGNGTFLQQIFGSKVSAKANPLSNPIPTEELLESYDT